MIHFRKASLLLGLATSAAVAAGCTSYEYAKNVSMVSYSDNVQRGAVSGELRGADCTWFVMGYPLGGVPTLDRAMANARQGKGESVQDALTGGAAGTGGARYLNNVSTSWDGFNAGVVGKTCLVVKGMSYQ